MYTENQERLKALEPFQEINSGIIHSNFFFQTMIVLFSAEKNLMVIIYS